MQFMSDLIVGFLSVYLAFTNLLADGLTTLLTIPQPESVTISTAESTMTDSAGSLTTLPSQYREKRSIPDILLSNSSYQQASLLGAVSDTAANTTDTLDAVVNIYCTYETEAGLRSTTGSGFFITPTGVIMTNAHVAQFLLLRGIDPDSNATCTIRTGSPAVAEYEAQLLYISPAWIQENSAQIVAEKPKGTGERDYALLYVHRALEDRPLPARFPYLSYNTDLLNKGQLNDRVTLAGYPAGNLSANTVNQLVSASAESTIDDLYTFNTNYADVIALSPSAIGQFGSSGGPVVNQAGEVIGLISTKGAGGTDTTSLRALTVSYIDRTMYEESGFDINNTASGQLAFRAQLFTETLVPFLGRILDAEFE